MRGEKTVSMKVRRGEGIEEIELAVPAYLDEVKRAGVHVSGMVVGRSTMTGYDASVMWVQFVDDASTAEQSQINEGDQVVSINGANVRSLREVLTAFKEVEGREVEVIIRRPRFSIISGRFEHFVRNLEVKNVFEVDENGVRR
jgi:C-terminal processing protease CtpA/Prc